MRKGLVLSVVAGLWAMGAAVAPAQDVFHGHGERVWIRDECDPADPAWEETGGCDQRRGDVTLEEFSALLFSSLSGGSIIGHPAWTMDPVYTRIRPHQDLRVRNVGGRGHTFTEVAAFGGGFVPDLNGVLEMAPECAEAAVIAAGERVKIEDLDEGDHYFQCCIHPWMRMVVNVDGNGDGDDDDDDDSTVPTFTPNR